MQNEQNNQKTTQTKLLPFKVGDKVWVMPKKDGLTAPRLTLILTPNRKLGTDFYIFVYDSSKGEETNLFIVKENSLDNFFFSASRGIIEQRLIAVAKDKFKDVFPTDVNINDKISLSNTSETFASVIVDLPQQEQSAGIAPSNPKADRAAKHPKNIKNNNQPSTEEPTLSINKGE